MVVPGEEIEKFPALGGCDCQLKVIGGTFPGHNNKEPLIYGTIKVGICAAADNKHRELGAVDGRPGVFAEWVVTWWEPMMRHAHLVPLN